MQNSQLLHLGAEYTGNPPRGTLGPSILALEYRMTEQHVSEVYGPTMADYQRSWHISKSSAEPTVLTRHATAGLLALEPKKDTRTEQMIDRCWTLPVDIPPLIALLLVPRPFLHDTKRRFLETSRTTPPSGRLFETF